MAYHRCNEGRTLITYCVCGRDATIDESPIIDATRARIAQAIRALMPLDGPRIVDDGSERYRVLTEVLRVVEGG